MECSLSQLWQRSTWSVPSLRLGEALGVLFLQLLWAIAKHVKHSIFQPLGTTSSRSLAEVHRVLEPSGFGMEPHPLAIWRRSQWSAYASSFSIEQPLLATWRRNPWSILSFKLVAASYMKCLNLQDLTLNILFLYLRKEVHGAFFSRLDERTRGAFLAKKYMKCLLLMACVLRDTLKYPLFFVAW